MWLTKRTECIFSRIIRWTVPRTHKTEKEKKVTATFRFTFYLFICTFKFFEFQEGNGLHTNASKQTIKPKNQLQLWNTKQMTIISKSKKFSTVKFQEPIHFSVFHSFIRSSVRSFVFYFFVHLLYIFHSF